MSLIWKPEDPDRAPPKVIVNRSATPKPSAGPAPQQMPRIQPEIAHDGAVTRRAPKYGVVDTTFSTVDMGAVALRAFAEAGVLKERVLRRTVPGFKDLAVAAKQMIERDGCGIVLVCGMPGPEPIDKQCGHESSLAIGQAQLMTSTHILECFVHMDEAKSDAELIAICNNRVAEHAVNAYWLMERPEELVKRAGTGQRQGFGDLGPADPKRAEGTHLRPSS